MKTSEVRELKTGDTVKAPDMWASSGIHTMRVVYNNSHLVRMCNEHGVETSYIYCRQSSQTVFDKWTFQPTEPTQPKLAPMYAKLDRSNNVVCGHIFYTSIEALQHECRDTEHLPNLHYGEVCPDHDEQGKVNCIYCLARHGFKHGTPNAVIIRAFGTDVTEIYYTSKQGAVVVVLSTGEVKGYCEFKPEIDWQSFTTTKEAFASLGPIVNAAYSEPTNG